jgi:hypothetical protein
MSDDPNQGNPADVATRRAAREAAEREAAGADTEQARVQRAEADRVEGQSRDAAKRETDAADAAGEKASVEAAARDAAPKPAEPFDPFRSPTAQLEPLAEPPPMESTLPWPSYVSHKIVQAAPIVHISAPPETDGPLVIWVEPKAGGPRVAFAPTEPAMAARAQGGDFAILYPDGFKSVSPRLVFTQGYNPMPTTAEAMAAAPALGGDPAKPPILGVLVHDMGDGTVGIHGIEPDGTEHAITMPAQHGALLAFLADVKERFKTLGERSLAHSTRKPGDPDEIEPFAPAKVDPMTEPLPTGEAAMRPVG